MSNAISARIGKDLSILLLFADDRKQISRQQVLILLAAFAGKRRANAVFDVDYVLFGHHGRRCSSGAERSQRPLSASQRASKCRALRRLVASGLMVKDGCISTLTDVGEDVASFLQAFVTRMQYLSAAEQERLQRNVNHVTTNATRLTMHGGGT
jgi:hypothetical protein